MKRLFILLGLVVLLLQACSNSEEQESKAGVEQTSASKDIVKIGWADSGFLSPFTFGTSGPIGFLRNSYLFDALTWKDDTGVIPWLAKSWEVSEDGFTYTFQLNEANFHDGEPLTAEDVAFSYEYFQKHPFQWNVDMTKVEKAEVINDYEVRIQLKEPFSPFITEIAGMLPIIPKHIWSAVKNPLEYRESDALIGSGPFILKHYDEASGHYQFVKNESFFKGEVVIDELQYLNVENRVLSLQKGEINNGMTFKYDDVAQLEKEGFSVLKSEPTGSAVRIIFNLDHPQLKEKQLRQAIAHGLNRIDMSQKLTGSKEAMEGSSGIIPPDSDWYNRNVPQYDYDVERAKEMLTALGYKEKLELNVLVSSTSKEAELMQAMLRDIGITLSIQTAEPATFAALMAEGNFDMAITGHIGLSGDPDFLCLWFSGQASNLYAGKSVFQHEGFTKLAEAQLRTQDGEARKKFVDEMQMILGDELPTLVLYHRPFYHIYDASVFDGWFNTKGGIADGIPLVDNKAAFVR